MTLEEESTKQEHWQHQAQQWHAQIWQTDFIISHTACLQQPTSIREVVISQTTLTKQLKLEHMHTILHHSEQQVHHMNNMASTIEVYLGKMACFTVILCINTTIRAYTTLI